MPRRLTQEEFIKRAKELHGDKYDYSKVEYTNSITKVCIICKRCGGEFFQTPDKHIYSKHGCKKCECKERDDKRRITLDRFIQLANKVHNNKYDYSKVSYVNIQTNVCIICPIHGEFWQTPGSHVNQKQGCPKCAILKKRSIRFGVSIPDNMLRNQNDFYICQRWNAILQRCYKPFGKTIKKIYNGCEVCEEWRYFPKFKEWFNLNYIKGWEIDKDVLFKGNKLYSPETCCFLPKEVNSFFTIKRRRKKGNLPLGVFKQDKRFFVVNKDKRIFFNSEKEAYDFYVKTKNKHAIELAEKYKGIIDDRVYNILINFDVQEYTK